MKPLSDAMASETETVAELRRLLAERDADIEALKATVDRLNRDLLGAWHVVDLSPQRATVQAMDAGDVTVPAGPETPFLQAIGRSFGPDFPAWLERQRGKRDAK